MPLAMIVRPPRLTLDARHARLCVRVESESGAFSPCELAIGVPRAYADWLDTSGTPWVPPLLLLAATLKEPLRVEAPVSPRLLAGAARAADVFAEWWDVRGARVEAEPAESGPAGTETLCCFTRGVDSWFSVLTEMEGGERPHLLYAPDLDRHYSPPRRREAARRTQASADRLGLPLLVVEIDVRTLVDRFVIWDDAFGGVIAGIALTLGAGVARFLLPAGYDPAHLAPNGGHPDLDPLWSTERTTVVHHGGDVARSAKVRRLATAPDALATLKVCWEEDIDDNCGRCRKCLRTMLQLAIAGALDRTTTFAAPLSLDAFVALSPPRRDRRRMLFAELYDAMPDTAEWAEWKEALRARLSFWHPDAPARTPVPDGLRIVVEAPPGTAVRLASPLALGVLGIAIVPRDEQADDPSDVRRLEISWSTPTAGRAALPWRPPARHREALLAACRDPHERPVRWCLLDLPTPGTAEVMRVLTGAWGPGVVCTPHRHLPDADHGTPRDVAAAIQRAAAVRVWRGDASGLDPFRVLEALRHGCLPLQCVTADEHEVLAPQLPRGLDAFLLALDPSPGPLDVAARLDRGLAVVLAGSLERDIHHVLGALAAA
jgi:hypothetical protein